jgi:hypothetical protein
MISSEEFLLPLAANMSAAFKKVRGAIGDNPTLRDLIATRIVEGWLDKPTLESDLNPVHPHT